MDFDFAGDEFDFNRSPSTAGSNKSKGKKRSFGERFLSATNDSNAKNRRDKKPATMDTNSSLSSSSSIRSTNRPVDTQTNRRLARRRIRRRQEYEDNDDDDLDSIDSNSSASTERYSVGSFRSRAELSVRRGTGAFAGQDAGTYRMIHDQITFLCSTILSKTTLTSKAIDSALELATLLSVRKTRSMLWQDRDTHRNENDDAFQKPAPIPKVWSSILEVLALAATTTTTGSAFENHASSNSSISSSHSVRSGPQKPRTKSARRKEKALLGISQINATNSASNNNTKLNADMRTVLSCILYYISWDCTLSSEHSIAVLGAVQKPQVARRIRKAILERGQVLMGIMKLMLPTVFQNAPARRWVPFPSKVVPTQKTPVSPLKTRSRRSSKEITPKTNGSPTLTLLAAKPAGDPTAMGRRKRKNRKQNSDKERMPPPATRTSDELSFADSKVSSNDGSLCSELSTPLGQRIAALRAKVQIESSSDSGNLQNTATHGIEGDLPWLSIVCLESLNRIFTGKELDGKVSSLEGDDDQKGDDSDDSENDEVKENVVMVTNRLVGKSGMIPLLSHAMSQSMQVATKIVFESLEHEDEYWAYCHDRLKLLASIVDEACFFADGNRASFCQDDPFDFSDTQKGLVYHVLVFLQHCCQCNLNKPDPKRSETMSLALRTLTSLTHDNPLASKQMKDFVEVDFSADGIQGIQVLANLAFQLEESTKKSASKKRSSDHDMHRYDGTVFCLTTLANIIEDSGIGRILMELKLKSGKSWLKWLCQWVVEQTESFRQDLLSIGKAGNKHSVGQEFNLGEEEKLLSAGNGCVVLACLMTKSDGDDPESSQYIRTLIEKQMPRNAGLSLVVNTMRAYCNYYHMSMGQMSLAVVSPVKKLIRDVEELMRVDS